MSYEKTIQTVEHALIEIFDELDTWFDKSSRVRSFAPSDGGWTIDENLEHITLTSHYLLKIIRKGVARAIKRYERGQMLSSTESNLKMLIPVGEADSFEWHRPEHMIPTGEKSIGEVRALMHDQQAECLLLLQQMSNGEGSLYTVRMSVNNSGKIDMYQWLYFLALHAKRHISQIVAVYAESHHLQE